MQYIRGPIVAELTWHYGELHSAEYMIKQTDYRPIDAVYLRELVRILAPIVSIPS